MSRKFLYNLPATCHRNSSLAFDLLRAAVYLKIYQKKAEPAIKRVRLLTLC